MGTCSMITLALLFLAGILGASCWFLRIVQYEANRYAIESDKAFKRFSNKLHNALDIPKEQPPFVSNINQVEDALQATVILVEEISNKIKDETSRIKVESTFMIVRGMQTDMPVRICVGNTVFNLSEHNHNHVAVIKTIDDLNNTLRKINES